MARPKSALIVDDEAHVRVFVRLLLKELGIETCWDAADGAQALAMVERYQPELVMLDVNLPLKGGMEVLAELREKGCEVPVIMVSAQNAMDTVVEAARLGATSYVLKHSPKAEALRTLRDAVESLDDEPDADSADNEAKT